VARDQDSTISILEQASHWWEILNSDTASTADHREFGEWVARSPERVEAYLRTAQLIRALKSSKSRWPSTRPEVLIREAKASPQDALRFPSCRSVPTHDSRRNGRSHQMRFALGIAAALLVCAGTAWVILQKPQQFQTEIGEQRSILLGDGSRVTLNTASKIEVDLRKDRRLVRLVEGEVLFDVTHDAMRPFKVRAGNVVLSDIGTQFNVDMRPKRTTVTVIEGRVVVNPGGSLEHEGEESNREGLDPSHKPLTLAASDSVVITSSGLGGAPQHGINATAAIAWTQRQLMFEHRPLSEVAEEFNRYNSDRIEIDSVELQRREVTGVFNAKDPASFLSFLSTLPGVVIRERSDGAHMVMVENKATNREFPRAR
jgi:transmembrane sensor